jgi:hypothetical protein
MTELSPEMHALAVRNELASLALAVHRITNEAGGDLNDACSALADIEERVQGARRALLELPREGEERITCSHRKWPWSDSRHCADLDCPNYAGRFMREEDR